MADDEHQDDEPTMTDLVRAEINRKRRRSLERIFPPEPPDAA